MIDAKIEDLKLAWERMKSGRPDRVFINHPFLIKMVENNLEGWLSSIQERLKNGYEPSSCVICQVPKPNYLVRPASYITIEDELVYTYLVGMFYPNIFNRIKEHQGVSDIAYQLDKDLKSKKWVRSDFRIWKQWREKSVKLIDNDCEFVVVSDITGYYENIEVALLISDVKELCGKSKELDLLSKMLNLWGHPRQKGIPQGYFASDILAKLYLTTIDETLKNEGFRLLRYVDDYRFFVENKLRAKQLIKRFAHLIHQRGLNLQSAKTETLDKESARQKFDGISQTIDEIQSDLRTELQSIMGMEDVSISSYDMNKILENTGDTSPEVLEKTFETHFLNDNDSFNKTLLHYLLVRLGKVNSNIAVDYCLRQILERPEETLYILRYFSAIGINDEILNSISDYLDSENSIYDYQVYTILHWALNLEVRFNRFLDLARSLAFDLNKDYWLRSYSIAYLGKYGSNGDLELIEQHYPNAATEIEKSDCINSLNRMEPSRRNSFYNRVKNQHFLVSEAVKMNK